MSIQIGDVLVYNGKSSRRHLNNFKVGDFYVVSDITSLPFDDNVDPMYETAVLFRDFRYGVYLCEIDYCFDRIEDYRDKKLDTLDL